MLHRLAVGWGRFVKLFHNKPTEGQADRKAAVPVLEKTAGKTEATAEEHKERFDYLMSDKLFESTMLSESFPGSGVYGTLDSKLTLAEQSHLLRLLLQKGQFVDRGVFRNKVLTYSTFQQGLEDLGLTCPADQVLS